jgi:succinate dehydrogenase flavin-adding protein (antitoxin of CptAB toxin-antitoxin module)
MDAREAERLKWRSRRGLLELDLILTRFWARGGAACEAEAQALAALLDLPDNDLLDLLMGRATLHDPALAPIVERLKAV